MVDLAIHVDSKDIYRPLCTQLRSMNKSIRDDVNVLRFRCEVGNADLISRLSGIVTFGAPCTRKDSPFCQALQLSIHSGQISTDPSVRNLADMAIPWGKPSFQARTDM